MKRQFFTLVELLLVIAIIAILAGIAIPVVGSMNKKGKETKARSEINAIIIYCAAWSVKAVWQRERPGRQSA